MIYLILGPIYYDQYIMQYIADFHVLKIYPLIPIYGNVLLHIFHYTFHYSPMYFCFKRDYCFVCSFQRKVEMFHEGLVNGFGENEDGYIAKTIALVNCCPPFRWVSSWVHFTKRSSIPHYSAKSDILISAY